LRKEWRAPGRSGNSKRYNCSFWTYRRREEEEEEEEEEEGRWGGISGGGGR